MKINGREIAQQILQSLVPKVTPHLVVILIGDDPISKAYVKQKELKAKEIGAKVTILNLDLNISSKELFKAIEQCNNDDNINGIIVQRPLPAHLDSQAISLAITPQKDIDGFHPQSKFQPPLATAVLRILEKIRGSTPGVDAQNKKIVIIGKGKTGGEPIIKTFQKMGLKPEVIDSQTTNPQLITKSADIVISCVGKPKVVRPEMIKKGTILIGVGLYKDSDGKLHGDYNEEQIKNIASFYTPTPGGVGPVNVACLLKNLVSAANSAVDKENFSC